MSPQGQEGWVPFAVAAAILAEQTQYASRYHTGTSANTVLSEGLRISELGPDGNYHELRIHPDDVAEFTRRVAAYKVERGSKGPGFAIEVEDRLERWLDAGQPDSFPPPRG